MKIIALASLIASAAAFAPAQQHQGTIMSSLSATGKEAFGDALGAQVPLGYFDPLGLCADGDVENFERLRCVRTGYMGMGP